MTRTLWILFLLSIGLPLAAQLPTDFRSEQIYLNPEKHCYQPGDTIRIEGQVTCMAENRLLPYSNYLYMELLSEQDSVLTRQKLTCKEKGYFTTRLVVDIVTATGSVETCEHCFTVNPLP